MFPFFDSFTHPAVISERQLILYGLAASGSPTLSTRQACMLYTGRFQARPLCERVVLDYMWDVLIVCRPFLKKRG